MIAKAIYGRLINSASVTAIVEDRVWAELRDADEYGVRIPCIVFSVDGVDAESNLTMDGASLKFYDFTINCIASNPGDADDIAEAVKGDFDNETFTQSGIVIQDAWVKSENTDALTIEDSEDTYFVTELQMGAISTT